MNMIQHSRTDQGGRLFVQYVVRYAPVEHRKELLIQAVRHWLLRNSLPELTTLMEPLVSADDELEDVSLNMSSQHLFSQQTLPSSLQGYTPYSRSQQQTAADTTATHTNVQHVTHTTDGLVAAMLMHSLGSLTRMEYLSILCDAIEAFPPLATGTRQGSSDGGNSMSDAHGRYLGDPSGYTELHLSLWRSVANVLGPLEPDECRDREIVVSQSSELSKHMSTLDTGKSLHSRYMDVLCGQTLQSDRLPIVPGVFGENMMNVTSALKYYGPKQSRPFTYVPLPSTSTNGVAHEEEKEEEGTVRNHTVDSTRDTLEETDISGGPPASPTAPDNSSNDLVSHMRQERGWWADGGGMFSVQNIGNELAWNVLECSAEKAVSEAMTRHGSPFIQSIEPRNRYMRMHDLAADAVGIDLIYLNEKMKCMPGGIVDDIGGGADIGVTTRSTDESDLQTDRTDTDEEGGRWDALVDWCDAGNMPYLYYRRNNSSRCHTNTDAYVSTFFVRKLHVELERTTEHWKEWPQTLTRKDSLFRYHGISFMEKSIAYALGNGILEILTYQIIVYCHLTKDRDSLFVAMGVQILVQHASWEALDFRHDDKSERNRDAALRCIGYLTSMNFDVPRAIRVGNILRGRGTDCRVGSMEVLPLPLEEQVLHSSRDTYSYECV